jgi:hypothetical protein
MKTIRRGDYALYRDDRYAIGVVIHQDGDVQRHNGTTHEEALAIIGSHWSALRNSLIREAVEKERGDARADRRKLDAYQTAMLDAADILAGLSMGTEGILRGRICSAMNRLNHALGRTISSHGDQPCPKCGTFKAEKWRPCPVCPAP